MEDPTKLHNPLLHEEQVAAAAESGYKWHVGSVQGKGLACMVVTWSNGLTQVIAAYLVKSRNQKGNFLTRETQRYVGIYHFLDVLSQNSDRPSLLFFHYLALSSMPLSDDPSVIWKGSDIMSAYGHQMEREHSTQTLSSRGGSEMGSHYVVESGIYMTSFAATIFIGALVTFGILLLTLLIALTVMLQSCQSKSAGVVEIEKLSDDYNYCKIYVLHAELNGLEADDFPSICKDLAVRYIKEGQYARDLNFTMWVVEGYFNSITPVYDGLDVVLMDIDDVLPSNIHYTNLYRFDQYGCTDCVEEAMHLKHMLILRLYMKLQASGWPLILLSRNPEEMRNATLEHLISVCHYYLVRATSLSGQVLNLFGDAGFIMQGLHKGMIFPIVVEEDAKKWRLDNEMEMNSREYFSRRRAVMQKEGFRITGIISSQMDALTGPFSGKRVFKLPNPTCYRFEHHIEGTNIPL
ncbi:hypothetical protein L1049_012061 [Liquidambar formosana]|uniref:Acid phosphatase n=1 Tax=Liquidambar formosana TaxID=63359 RepID=A0AAP0WYI7_LIQFO